MATITIKYYAYNRVTHRTISPVCATDKQGLQDLRNIIQKREDKADWTIRKEVTTVKHLEETQWESGLWLTPREEINNN